MSKQHTYTVTVNWTGNRGTGTSAYRDYGRDHTIEAQGKPLIPASSDPAFRGEAARYNPEDLLVASAAACHMLWYLHLCSLAGIIVVAYTDQPVGLMEETSSGGGHFAKITLNPEVTLEAGADLALAKRLHDAAHEKCFIANSVNFPILHEVTVWVEPVVSL